MMSYVVDFGIRRNGRVIVIEINSWVSNITSIIYIYISSTSSSGKITCMFDSYTIYPHSYIILYHYISIGTYSLRVRELAQRASLGSEIFKYWRMAHLNSV